MRVKQSPNSTAKRGAGRGGRAAFSGRLAAIRIEPGHWLAAPSASSLPETRPAPRAPHPARRALDSVFGDLAGDGVAVDAEQLGGFAEVAFRPLQGPRDRELLELAADVLVVDALLQHVRHQPLEGLAHGLLTR